MTDTKFVYTDTLSIVYVAVSSSSICSSIQHYVFTCKMNCVSHYLWYCIQYYFLNNILNSDIIRKKTSIWFLLMPKYPLYIFKYVTYLHSTMHSWYIGIDCLLMILNKCWTILSHRLSLEQCVLESMCGHYSSYTSGYCIC